MTSSPRRGFLPSLQNVVSVEGGIQRQISYSSSESGAAKRTKMDSRDNILPETESLIENNSKKKAEQEHKNTENIEGMETEEKDESI